MREYGDGELRGTAPQGAGKRHVLWIIDTFWSALSLKSELL